MTVDNFMADDIVWQESKPKKCRKCGLVQCICEEIETDE